MNAFSWRRVGLIIGKEVRENAKWAGIALLVMGLFVTGILRNAGDTAATQLWTALNMLMLYAALISGYALGFLQIVRERSRDRWAFLIHRPVLRDELVVGKALAGGLLIAI